MPRPKDYYEILGVDRNATPAQLKKKYRQLALKVHPDRNKGNKDAEERFKGINEAYAVLGDPEKRKNYDTFGSAKFHERFNQEDIFRGFDIGDILKDFGFTTDDVFSSVFGSRGRRKKQGQGGSSPFGPQAGSFQDFFGRSRPSGNSSPTPPRGADLSMDLSISLEEEASGVTRNIGLTRGGRPEQLAVKVPAGATEGTKLRLAGKGEPGPAGGAPGDLYITVHLMPHPVFRTEQNDLYFEREIRFSEALLGTTLEVPTLVDGPRRVRVPACATSGTRIRLPGMGLPRTGGGERGDAYLVLRIAVPGKLNARQKQLAEELAREGL